MPRRSKEQREVDRTFIANLLLRQPHLRIDEIWLELQRNRAYELSVSTIESDIAAVREGTQYLPLTAIEKWRLEELNQINARQSFCWAVFQGSLSLDGTFEFLGAELPQHRNKTLVQSFEYILDDNGDLQKVPSVAQSKVESLQGNAEWLRSCLSDCSKARRELLGLDAPKKTETTLNAGDGYAKISPEHQEIIDKAYG